jgi:predicted GIY-YIG superfamily endonuclease
MSEPAEVVPLTNRSHVLYRMYDSARQLLYVGITFDPRTRWKAHGEDKAWWTDVSSIDVQHFTSRTAADRAERRAIRSDRPLYNVAHSARPTTGSPLKNRNVRMDDRTWFSASRVAELRGTSASDLLRSLLRGFVTRNRKLLDNDETWQETLRSNGWVE